MGNTRSITRARFVAGIATLALAPLTGSAFAASNTTSNLNQTMYHVGQNPGDCFYNPTLLGVTAKSGQAVFHVNAKNGTTVLDVSFSGAVPNSEYDVDIRCTAPYPITTLVTDAYGNGSAEVTLTPDMTNYVDHNSFYVDSSQHPYDGSGFTGSGGYGDTFISSQFNALGS